MIEANCGRVYVGKAAPSSSGGNYIPTSQKGAANGVATLDANTLIPAAQIPVDNDTITVENGKIKANGGSVPDNVYTQSNLLGGKGVSILQKENKNKITEDTLALWHFNGNLDNVVSGSKFTFNGSAFPSAVPSANWLTGNAAKFDISAPRTGTGEGNRLYMYLTEALTLSELTIDFWMTSNHDAYIIGPYDSKLPDNYMLTGTPSSISITNLSETDLLTAQTPSSGWFHVALVYGSSDLSMFVNGHKAGSIPRSGNVSWVRGDVYLQTEIDELRITKKALWTSDFEPAQMEYPVPDTFSVNTDEALEEWEKPASWVDLRSGALPNSVYLLAAHSADFATYPTLTVYAEVSDSSTYDVYVDGIKKASAVASGTATTLSWGTVATGYDVDYPSALRTNIVRITPTDSTKTITRINNQDGDATVMTGVLWAHFTTANYINLRMAFKNLTHLEAVTTKDDTLNVLDLYNAFGGCSELKTVPTFDGNSSYNYRDAQAAFSGCVKLQKISFENFLTYRACSHMFNNCSALKKISTKKSAIKMWNNVFDGCAKLESLPDLENGAATTMDNVLAACTSLKETVLDLSGEASLTKLSIGASETNRVDGLKGVIVSPSAPFSASPFVDVSYTGLERAALVALFDSLPTVSGSQVCKVTGCTGASDLTAEDMAVATVKGWTVTR